MIKKQYLSKKNGDNIFNFSVKLIILNSGCKKASGFMNLAIQRKKLSKHKMLSEI